VRIKELSATTEVSVATLKYYLREGLLHAGAPTAVNQADYDDTHVRRVRLVRALLSLGHLSIADARRVVDAVDDEAMPIHSAFGVAQDAMVPTRDRSDARYVDALAAVDRFVARHELTVRPEASVRSMLADAVVAVQAFGSTDVLAGDLGYFDRAMAAALASADAEVGTTPSGGSRVEQMEYVVVGTIAFETALNAIRRLALEHASAQRFNSASGRRSRPANRQRRVATDR
jgi:DNA-binding transcriptional MerR regulator